jgi:TrmH family RNA methyltransferase
MKIESISSTTNPKFKSWRSLLTSKGIREEGLCLVSGSKIISEVLENKNLKVAAALLPNENELNSFRGLDRVYTLSAELFKELDVLGTHTPLLVVETPKIDAELTPQPKGLEVVIPLSDPSNVGALIRSCVAFGARKIILTREAAHPFLPKALRASAGMSLMAPLVSGPKLEEFAKEVKSSSLFALDMKGQDISDFRWPQDVRLIVGEEGQGLPASLEFVTRLAIPIDSKAESLNAVVASSIALYGYKIQKN